MRAIALNGIEFPKTRGKVQRAHGASLAHAQNVLQIGSLFNEHGEEVVRVTSMEITAGIDGPVRIHVDGYLLAP